MKHLYGEMKIEAMGIEINHTYFLADSNNHAEIYTNTGTIFNGYLLEAFEIWKQEKKRLQEIVNKNKNIEAKLIVIKSPA